jgi:hypothetical protein
MRNPDSIAVKMRLDLLRLPFKTAGYPKFGSV